MPTWRTTSSPSGSSSPSWPRGPRWSTSTTPTAPGSPQELDCVTFSAAGAAADFRAVEVEFDASGSSFVLEGPAGRLPVRTPLPGHFNVANALGAIAAAGALGVSPEVAA